MPEITIYLTTNSASSFHEVIKRLEGHARQYVQDGCEGPAHCQEMEEAANALDEAQLCAARAKCADEYAYEEAEYQSKREDDARTELAKLEVA